MSLASRPSLELKTWITRSRLLRSRLPSARSPSASAVSRRFHSAGRFWQAAHNVKKFWRQQFGKFKIPLVSVRTASARSDGERDETSDGCRRLPYWLGCGDLAS